MSGPENPIVNLRLEKLSKAEDEFFALAEMDTEEEMTPSRKVDFLCGYLASIFPDGAWLQRSTEYDGMSNALELLKSLAEKEFEEAKKKASQEL